jgi:hypothetical protein
MKCKSLGIVVDDYKEALDSISFLKETISVILNGTEDSYRRSLVDYYDRNISAVPSGPNSMFKETFSSFVMHLGPLVFQLTEMVLLSKRILIYCKPPVENSCYYGTLCLLL